VRRIIALGLGLTAFVVAARARALDNYPIFIVPGLIHSFGGGDSPASGNGVELSTAIGVDDSYDRGAAEIGAFTQLESLSGDHGRSTRWSLGMQGSVLGLGLEGGYAQRSADDAHSMTRGLHLAAFWSLGYVVIAYRWTIGLGNLEGTHGVQHGFVLGLKFPLQIRGDMRDYIDLPPMLRGGPITYGN
jgi:hypothetical protein